MRTCKIKNCDKKHHGRGYCKRHYLQLKRYGKILKRTRRDPNRFIFEKNICKIELYNHKNEVVGYGIIDKEDYRKIKKYKWCLSPQGYVVTWDGKRLHRLINNTFYNYDTDHIDNNKLNNRKENLRVCTKLENSRNVGLSSNNSSGFKGVWWENGNKKWRALINANGMAIHLGCFANKNDAARAYNCAAIKYHGEFAKLNRVRMAI